MPQIHQQSTRLDLSRVLLDPECGSCIRDPNPSTYVRFELWNAATKKYNEIEAQEATFITDLLSVSDMTPKPLLFCYRTWITSSVATPRL